MRSSKCSPFLRLGLLICGLCVWVSPDAVDSAPESVATAPVAEAVVLPKSLPDPLEPMNRLVWAFNQKLMAGVIEPTSRVYRFIVVKPVRAAIGRFGRNITYPKRLLNNLLQARWSGAWDETRAFVCNSTVGVGGLFDPASKWKIPRSDADFGQTLGLWGWKPAIFLMLPVFGPSSERDTIGLAADTASNPLLYVVPYRLDTANPLTYLGPYTYATYVIRYNDLSDTVGDYVRFDRTEMDSYFAIQYAWTFARSDRVADFSVNEPVDEPSMDTLRSAFFGFQDARFPDQGKTRSVKIQATGRSLKYTFWLRPGSAPVVYIVPGLGSHRLSPHALGLAELVYRNGFSVVCVSSVFHPEFMEHAASAAMPGYLPVDGRDLHAALTTIDLRLRMSYPNRLGRSALMGLSMGALHTMYVAATAAPSESRLMGFDRYVAIDTPVQMMHGVRTLDSYYEAPLDWVEGERTARIENTFLKVAELRQRKVAPEDALPFGSQESRFLIGLTFRMALRDIIYSSQRRIDQHVLVHPVRTQGRAKVYSEILQYSYRDYLERFVAPYFEGQGVRSPTVEAIESSSNLRTYEAQLRANANVRVIVNQNDFLLGAEDLHWIQATFPSTNVTVFPHGGHMGNLHRPEVQRAIYNALEGLGGKPVQGGSAPANP